MVKSENHIQFLIEGCLKGNRSHQRELYELFYGYGLKIALRCAQNREEATEMLNDAFLKIFTKIHQYLGLGYGAVTSLPYEVDYEFKNGSLGTVWEISQKINKRVTQWDFLLFDVGFEKRIAKYYRWQIGANYRLKLSNKNQSYKLLGLKTGVLFDF